MTNKLLKLLPSLKCIANQLYGYYGGEVYLVGSSLQKENCRDIDIRIIITDVDFERLFGKYSDFAKEYNSGDFGITTWRWVDDRLKRCRDLSKRTGENIDFCCWHTSIWKPDEYPNHMRLDTKSEFESSLH